MFHVDLEKNIKNAVVLYKKILNSNKTINPKVATKFILD